MTSEVDAPCTNSLELLDRALQSLDDGLALVGDALPLKRLALGFGFRLLDHENLFSLASGIRRDLLALRRIDVIHGRFHLGIGNDVGHQHVHDFVSERRHIGVEFFFHRQGNSGLACENLIERHPRDVTENDLLDVGLNLLRGIGQLVKCIINFFRPNLVLHRNRNGDEHVVFRLRLHGQIDLIDSQADAASNDIDKRPFPVQTRLSGAKKSAESGDHCDLRRAHGKKASQNDQQEKEGD